MFKLVGPSDETRGMSRTALIAVAIAGLFALAVVAVARLGLLPDLPKRPANLEVGGVLVDTLGLEGRAVFADPGLGRITDLHPHGFDGSGCGLVVGQRGAAWVGGDGCVPRRISFEADGTHVDAVDWDGDDAPEFLSRGEWCCLPFLLDDSGRLIWQFERGERDAVNDTAVLRDANGQTDLVVTFNGGSGLLRVSADGSERWQREDGNVWQVATIDADGDGRAEIAHSNAAGALVLRDADGEILSETRPEGYFSDFSTVAGMTPPAVSHVEDGRILIIGLDGRTRRTYEKGWAFDQAEPRIMVLHPEGPEHGPWLVALLSSRLFDRSVLAVHDASGHPAYVAVLEEPCQAIAPLGARSFWVGCGSHVTAYDIP